MFRLDDGDAPVLERLSGCLAWLLAMGFSREEVSGVWRTQLRMFRLPAELLQRNLASLRSRVPLSAEQQRRFVASSGALLGTDYEALLAKVRALGTLAARWARSAPVVLWRGGRGVGQAVGPESGVGFVSVKCGWHWVACLFCSSRVAVRQAGWRGGVAMVQQPPCTALPSLAAAFTSNLWAWASASLACCPLQPALLVLPLPSLTPQCPHPPTHPFCIAAGQPGHLGAEHAAPPERAAGAGRARARAQAGLDPEEGVVPPEIW